MRSRSSAIKKAVVAAAAAALLGMTGACAPSGVDQQSPSGTGGPVAGSHAPEKITVIQRGTVEGFAPDVTTARNSLRVSSMVTESLTRSAYKDGKFSVEPLLAESWTRTNDTTWRIKLRAGVKFTNGEPLTADAVESTLAAYYKNARGGGIALAGLTVKPISELELDIVSDDPAMANILPSRMTVFYIYPPKYYSEKGADTFNTAPIGTGPYTLASYQQGIQAELKANPDYWAGVPAVKQVTIRMVPDDSTRLAELEAGTADLITDVPGNLVDRAKSQPGVEIKQLVSARRLYVFFNANTAPTDDVRVRQAVNYAIDREAITKAVYGTTATPLNGIWNPSDAPFDPAFNPYPYDVEKAKALLAEAGYPNGIDIDYTYTIGYLPEDQRLSEALQGQLAKAGIRLNMDGGPFASIGDKVRGGNAPGMILWSYGPFYNDTSFIITAVQFGEKAAYRPYLPKDDTMTQLGVDAIRAEPDKSISAYQALQQYVQGEQAYWAPLVALNDTYAAKDTMSGWQPRPDGNYEFELLD